MAHLTCVGHTRDEVAELLDEYEANGIENILALGGDPPADGSEPGGDYEYALELVEQVRAHRADFSMGVAAHPELHPRSPDRESDRRHLAEKLAQADFGVTQFFFDADDHLRMVDELAALGCDTPVVPGVMLFTTYAGLVRMAGMNQTKLPAAADGAAGARAGRSRRDPAVAVDTCTELCQELLDAGVARPARLHAQPIGGRHTALDEPGPGLSGHRLDRMHPRRSPPAPTARLRSPTSRSSRSSAATAPASTSGRPRRPCSTRPPPSTARASPGRRCSPARRPSTRPASGCPKTRSTPSADHLIGIKGPLTTPVGGGIRSLNVALRQILDLYVCLRPVRWFRGVPSPVKAPEKVDMVIFRENTEDVYAGKELEQGTPEVAKLIEFLRDEFDWEIREDSGIGIKPVSITGSKRLQRAALNYAVERGRESVTFVHKGNIMKFTEGAFRDWGYELVREEFNDVAVGWDDCGGRARRPDPREGRHRRCLPPADPHPSRRVRRDRHDEPQRRLHLRRPGRRGGRASASPLAATSTTSPATPCSRPPTARHRSTPARTR